MVRSALKALDKFTRGDHMIAGFKYLLRNVLIL